MRGALFVFLALGRLIEEEKNIDAYLYIRNGIINSLSELDHPNMTLNRTIQCWPQHLLEECEL